MIRELKITKDDFDKFGCIDAQGNVLVPFEYDDMEVVENTEGQFLKVNEDWAFPSWGIIDVLNGRTVVPCQFEEVEVTVFGNDMFFIVAENIDNDIKKGLYDLEGEVLPSEYDEITIHFVDNKIFHAVQKDDKKEAFEFHERTLLPISYDDLIEKKKRFWKYLLTTNGIN